MSLIYIIVEQTLHLCILPPLSFTQLVVRRILKLISQRSRQSLILREQKGFRRITRRRLLLLYQLYRITKSNVSQKKRRNLMYLIELVKTLGSIYDYLAKMNIKITLTKRRTILVKCQHLYSRVKSYREGAGRGSL